MKQILVHEPTSRWTAELERKFTGQREIRFRWRPDRRDFLQEAPQADLLLAVVSADEAGLSFVRELTSNSRFIPLVCLMESDVPAWEWLARELGAAVVFPRLVEIDHLGASLARLLAPLGKDGA